MDVLERSLTYDEVTEIFVRVNSLGAKLRSSDLALAQITAKWRGALGVFQDFERRCAKDGFEVDLSVHLKNLVVFATGQSRFQTVGGIPRDALETAWRDCRRGMEFAISFLKSNLNIDSPALLSSPFLLVTTAYFGHLRGYDITPEASARFRYWALTANAKGRYSRGSSETLLDQDLATLRDGGDATALVDRLRQQVGRLDVSPSELIGRNQRSALFKTMFLAFREGQARDWHSDLVIALDHSGAQHRLQFHHIFPKALLRKSGRTGREADDIANLAFISGRTNQRISDAPPSVYINKLREAVGDIVLEAQCIPVEDDLLETANYDRFLVARRELIADRLNAFLGADDAGASSPNVDPQLRDLDTRIERVELGLRKIIADALDGDLSLVPQHVAQKVQERMTAAARRLPGGTLPQAATLTDRLAYYDLRELQDVVTSKALWPSFEPLFATKEGFNNRCGQLAELRNTIRHSRPLDAVTRKDGEAALHWFVKAMGAQPNS
jgi:hypothetical protein